MYMIPIKFLIPGHKNLEISTDAFWTKIRPMPITKPWLQLALNIAQLQTKQI